MLQSDPEPLRPRLLRGCLMGIVVLLLGARVVHLDADFPQGITLAGVLYTDEGWYANAATRHALTGQWYLPGDFNPAIAMPLGQALHRLAFGVFGPSLATARLTAVMASILAILFTAMLVRAHAGGAAAILTALLMASHFPLFAFSRLAIMENAVMAAIAASLFLADAGRRRRESWILMSIASAILGLGILTKASAAFALGPLALLAWQGADTWRDRATRCLAALAPAIAIASVYLLWASHAYPQDYRYFSQINGSERMCRELGDWWRNLVFLAWRMRALGIGFLLATAIPTCAALVVSSRYRMSPLVHVLLACAVCYLGMMSLVRYQPPRYYLPLAIPFAGLGATSCCVLMEYLGKRYPRKRLHFLPLIAILLVALAGVARMPSYLLHPRYTFRRMAREVGAIVRQRAPDMKDVFLFGHIADTVALEAAIPAVNSIQGALPLEKRLKTQHPRYLLLHSDDHVRDVVEALGGETRELKSWNVLGNYYAKGQPVRLLYVHWPTPTNSAPRQ